MKTFVFGATGMLGQDLLALSTKDNPITGVGSQGCRLESVDDIRKTIHQHQPDSVMLVAAWTDVDGAESHIEACYQVNVEGPRNVGTACAEMGIPVLFTSTDYVFSKEGPEPHLEDAPHAPLGIYGKSKSDGEQALRDSGCEHAIVRCSWLFGAHGKSFPRTMLQLAETRDTLSVVDDQIGAPTNTAHLAQGLIEVMRKGLRGNLHLAAQGQTSWCGLATELFKQAGKKITVNPVPTSEFPRPAPRPSWSVMSMSRCDEAGISLPSWKQGVADWLEAVNKV